MSTHVGESNNYTLLFRFQGSVRYKSDDAHTASTRNIEKISPRPQLYYEVKNIIESWMEVLNGNPPTEAQDKALKRAIFDLDKKITQARTASDVENPTESKAIGDLSEDITPDTRKPSTPMELAQCILESFTDEKLQEL